MELVLCDGSISLVDQEDFCELSKHKWFKAVDGNKVYARAIINGKEIRMHRFILKPPASMVVDHVNGNGLDNRRFNIRVCSVSQNSMNRGCQRNSSSKLKGVFLHLGKWQAKIRAGGKVYYLGRFATKEAAHAVYCEKAKELHGQFVNLEGPNG